MILLNLPVAFDTIHHGSLLDQAGIGKHHSAVVLVLSWKITFRRRYWKTAVQPLAYGIMQVSLLSTMVFSIYMKKLAEVIWIFRLGNHQYVDDTPFYLAFPLDSREAAEILNQFLEVIIN